MTKTHPSAHVDLPKDSEIAAKSAPQTCGDGTVTSRAGDSTEFILAKLRSAAAHQQRVRETFSRPQLFGIRTSV